MAPTATSNPPQIKSRLGAILRATSGNFLEQFDFFLFGFYASYIAKAFFPSQDETAALLNTFGVFWLGALMRPVGAIVLGAYIDRIGRRKGLIVTLAIMAAGTVTIAVCPTYASIGVAAPAIVLIGRLLQGFSAGVELGGVSVYLSEIATPGNKGFYTSFQSASQQVAIFVAAIIGFILSEMMPAADSRGVGLAYSFLHRLPHHSVHFLSAADAGRNAGIPCHEETSDGDRRCLLRPRELADRSSRNDDGDHDHHRHSTSSPSTRPTFGKTVLKLSTQDALLVTLMVAVTNFIWNPVGGALSDRIGRKPVLLTIACLSLVTAYPALNWLVTAPDIRQDAGCRIDVLVLLRRV